MYESWVLKEWVTPVSRAGSLQMVSLVDNVTLSIIVQDLLDRRRSRYRFTFKKYPAYRNIDEAFRSELWKIKNDKQAPKIGWTFSVEDSQWIESFNKEVLKDIFPSLVHYVIATEDDVVEVLSPTLPDITEEDPQPESEELPGKSIIKRIQCTKP
jgi:hypothetical protein